MTASSPQTLYWLKRDLRLLDNPALRAALTAGGNITMLYIVEPSMLEAPETSALHISAITQALAGLDRSMRARGAELLVYQGEVVDVLSRLHRHKSITRLIAHEEVGNRRTYDRDLAVHRWARSANCCFDEYRQTGVFRRLSDRNMRNKLWTTFYAAPIIPLPTQLDRVQIPEVWRKDAIHLETAIAEMRKRHPLSGAQGEYVQAVSEKDAHACLQSFFYERGRYYRKEMSSPLSAHDACSRLSVHFAWGTITGRYVYQQLQARLGELKALKSQGDGKAGGWAMSLRSFGSRLHWRDHFMQRLESEPDIEFQALHPAYRKLKYDNRPEDIEAWIKGRTGYPMVDACIRSLHATGYTNFRMRAMITSFACHVLSIDWRIINEPMARLYTDYEPGIHLAQLQMQAGVVGINTLRVYSPTKQILDQDPDCVFIKRWIPELREFTPIDILSHRNEALGDYPPQRIDWSVGSGIMKARIFELRKSSEFASLSQAVFLKHGSRKGAQKRSSKSNSRQTSLPL